VAVWEAYNKYQQMNGSDIDKDVEIIDFKRGLSDSQKARFIVVDTIPSETVAAAGMTFKSHGQDMGREPQQLVEVPSPCTIYEHKEFNGTFICV
jgi:alkylated DNA repair protein alkB family protein 1